MTQRVMLVTGGSRGIGAAVARRAAQRGFTVVVNYATNAAAAEAVAADCGFGAYAVRADIADADAVTALFSEIAERSGRLDALVNNAGISGPYGTFDAIDADGLNELLAINVRGPYLCAQHAVRLMDASGGVIVNISSKAAVLGGPNEWVHYAMSKGAIEAFTTGLARELAPRNIRVNAVRPGLVDNNFGAAPADRIERLTPMIPMRRVGTLDEVADAVIWLAADAPDYVTGTFIDVTGGR
jgi:NAD(P)-dependent dehydrogenase (short-subunit alcohol dehydrogenase family)